MMREPRTEPQRIGIEAPTNCGRSQLHPWHYVDARACAWKAVEGYVFLTDRQKNFGRGARAPKKSGADINKLRVLIAEHLQVEVRRVTDDAHLSRDLEADWLDRLELIILVEEIAGVEITDDEADQIEVVGDLIHYIDKRRD